MTQSKCNRCKTAIIWGMMPNGASLPFNRDPEPVTTPEGYVLRTPTGDDTGTLMALDRHEALDDEPTHAFHLAICKEQRARKGQ